MPGDFGVQDRPDNAVRSEIIQRLVTSLAIALDNLGIRMDQLGRHQEALAASREALELWRALARVSTQSARLPAQRTGKGGPPNVAAPQVLPASRGGSTFT